VITEAERLAAAPYCSGCGKPGGDHAPCLRPSDPPRYCADCGRKLAVQVTPFGYRASCVRCG
jgi:hypothetical protein